MSKEDVKIHAQCMSRVKFAQKAWEQQRKREREDLKFQVPDMQWDEDARAMRRGMMLGNVPIPSRPMLSVDILRQPVQLVQNAQRQAHLGVNLHPLSPDADRDTAEVLQDLYREMERRSQAELVRAWAFDRASKAGMGFYRVTTEYDEMGGHPFDQVVSLQRILDGSNVYLDPGAEKPDFSDGLFAFVMSWVPIETFKAEFPDADVPPVDKTGLTSDDQWTPEWVTGTGDDQAVCVAEYWRRVPEKEVLVVLANGEVVPEDEAKGALMMGEDGEPMKRERLKHTVYMSKHTAVEMIQSPAKWPGRYIPIIPVVGNELQPFDDQRRWFGIIHPAKDSQKAYNYSISQAIESVALEPKAPYTVYEGQLEGYESQWQQANIRNFPYLTIKAARGPDGSALPPPARVQVDASKMQMSLALSNAMQGAVQSTTQQYYESMGDGQGKDQSGKAIQALQQQAETSNSHYIANLADISMTYEARVVMDLFPVIYDRPGRVVQLVNEAEETTTAMVNAPFRSTPEGQPQRVDVPQGQPMPPGVKEYDLRKGSYGVSITIGRSYQSRLQQGADEIGQILQAHPEMFLAYGDLYFQYRDFPGAQEMSKRARKQIEKQMPFLLEPDEGQEATPEQLQTENASLKQKVQEQGQQIQAGQQFIQTKQVEKQVTLEKATLDNQTKLQLEQMRGQIDLLMKQMEIQAENTRTGAEIVHEATEGNKDRAHDLVKASQAQVHAVENAVIGSIKPYDPNFKGSTDVGLGGEDQY